MHNEYVHEPASRPFTEGGDNWGKVVKLVFPNFSLHTFEQKKTMTILKPYWKDNAKLGIKEEEIVASVAYPFHQKEAPVELIRWAGSMADEHPCYTLVLDQNGDYVRRQRVQMLHLIVDINGSIYFGLYQVLENQRNA